MSKKMNLPGNSKQGKFIWHYLRFQALNGNFFCKNN